MIKRLPYDPVGVQNLLVEKINGSSGFDLLDPTNSFTMLLEASSISTIDNLNELLSHERQLFPALAATDSDLFGHMIEYDERHFFASPAKTTLRIKISVDSMLTYGVNNGSYIYEIVIPRNSTFVVDNIDLTIMNDVRVTLNTQGNKYRAFVENVITADSQEFLNIGNLLSGITVDNENARWIEFDLPVMQVGHIEISDIVTLGLEFRLSVPFTGKYYSSTVHFTDNLGNRVNIPKVFTDTKFNPDELSVYVKVGTDHVDFIIPKIYIDNGLISGEVNFDVYNTNGKIQIALDKYTFSDYSFNVSRNTPTLEKAASLKLNYLVSSNEIMNGGVNDRSLRDMKTRIIYRATGNNNVPITEKQLAEHSRLEGFTLSKITDTLTDRIFLASRDTYDTHNVASIPATADLFNNSVEISADLVSSHISITKSTVVIKPNALFKSDNGIITPIPDNLNIIQSLSSKQLIEYLNGNRILYTPFLTIVDNDVSSTSSRVYDIENSKMDFVTIESKNSFLRENVNISGYNMFKVDDGFDIFFQLLGNANYDDIAGNVKIQLRLTNSDGAGIVYHSTIDAIATASRFGPNADPLHYIHISSDFIIDTEDRISLSGGVSPTLSTPIDIHTIGDITIYYPDASIVVPGEVNNNALLFLNKTNTIIDDGVSTNPIGMTKESIQITFADNMKYLWRRAFITYNGRKYKTHQTNVPLTYSENIYPDGQCGLVITTNPDGSCSGTELAPLHTAGDIVLDANGQPIYKNKIGDVVVDANGVPIIDFDNGLTRVVDLLMIDYMFKAVKKEKYTSHISFTIGLIRDWVLNKMRTLNDVVLEQTLILYKPNRSNSSVTINGNSSTNEISPTVTIYLQPYANIGSIDAAKLYNDVGIILSKFFSKKYIVINDLENEITGLFPEIGAVKVSGYLADDPLIIDIQNSHSRFALKKKISPDFDVLYDYSLVIK